MQEVEGRLREEKIKALLKERYSIFSDQYSISRINITTNEINGNIVGPQNVIFKVAAF